MDCSDGSDEKEEICDKTKLGANFVCCTTNRVISENETCDIFDHCPRDKSDQYLETCAHKTGGALKCLAALAPGASLWKIPDLITIQASQLNDGKEDCMFGIDETCAWKNNRDTWIDPFKSKKYQQYFQFLNWLETNPAATRWYSMATRKQIAILGHAYDVRVRKYYVTIWSDCGCLKCQNIFLVHNKDVQLKRNVIGILESRTTYRLFYEQATKSIIVPRPFMVRK